MILENYFFGIGLLVLIKLVWEDYKNKKKINQSNSAFMLGVVASMYVFNDAFMSFFLLMLIIPIVFAFRDRLNSGWFAKNFSIGNGDTLILTWVIAGLFLINYYFIFVFLLFWLITNTLTSIKFKDYVGTPSICLAFVLTWFLLMLL